MRYIRNHKTEHTLECSGHELMQLLAGQLGLPGNENDLPDDFDKIEVKIPGGGDWSNTKLDFATAEVVCSWEEVDEDVEETL